MTEILPLSPHVVAEWLPFAKPLGFFLATFVLEDVAAVGAGLLLATGGISWPAAFGACFLGIWMGDAGLYFLARYAGRGWFERSTLRRFSANVDRSEQWFAQRGTSVLIFSRLLPGARLPTYLAAGFLRVPLPRFLFITGVASCAWTLVILFLTQLFGERLLDWLGKYRHAGLLLLGSGIVLLVVLQLLRRAMMNFDLKRFMARIERWRHWEFWPAWMFYPPVAAYCGWLMVKYRGLTLPTLANPGFFSGGLIGESKMATLRELMTGSPEFTADAELLSGSNPTERLASLREICQRRNINLPFILKPDVGQRGAGIRLIRHEAQAAEYLHQTNAPLLVQRYAEGPYEVGVFYYRFPDQEHGRIFAITEKEFPVLTGDGHSTVEDLVWSDARARFMAGKYLRRWGDRKNTVLPAGETLKLVEAGNHAQGCIFRDGMHLCTPTLAECIDTISKRIPGFHIGRYDIRFSSVEDLQAGKNFRIIELNGASSEATSIYDARNSLFAAYRVLFRQWHLVFAIGAANRKLGCPGTGVWPVWQAWRKYAREAAGYPTAD